MECLLIPAMILGVAIILTLSGAKFSNWPWGIWAVLFWLAFIISIPVSIGVYAESMDTAVRMEAYYDTMIAPNAISCDGESCKITNVEASIWQQNATSRSGDISITRYNTWLASNRFWRKMPIVSTTIYPASPKLKYGIISQSLNEFIYSK